MSEATGQWYQELFATPEGIRIYTEEACKVAAAEALSEAAEKIERELVRPCIDEHGAGAYVKGSHHLYCWWVHLAVKIVRDAATQEATS